MDRRGDGQEGLKRIDLSLTAAVLTTPCPDQKPDANTVFTFIIERK